MEWLKRLGAAIDYIEENLDKEISYDEAAHIACCSTYYFQRIFSYVSGVSLSEYIRRRKMTQAAFELQRTDNKVIDVAHKYGYSSPTSFNRAFQSVHGIAPIAAKSMGCTLCAYPSIQFSIIVLGGSAMAYHIEEKKSIRIIGIRISLMATLAQEESRKTSERVKAGQKISRDNGVLYGNGNILGYDRVGDTYVINEEQAETVRMIYDLYLQGYGSMKIAKILTERKRKTASGLIKWSVSNIMRAIKNATYTGTKCYNKSRSNNFLEQKRINNLDMSTYEYVEGDFPSIISQEIWDKAQAIRESRVKPVCVSAGKNTHSKRDSRDIWVNKLRCSCGSSYRKNKWHTKLDGKTSYGYQCYNQLNNGIKRKRAEIGLDTEGYCDSRMITDWKLDFMAKALLEHLWTERKESVLIALDLIKYYYKEEKSNETQSDTVTIQAKLDKANSRLTNLIAMRADGEISKDEYQAMRSPVDEEIKKLQKALDEIPQEKSNPKGLDIEGIRSTLNSFIDFSGSTISHDVVNQFVYLITPTSDTTFDWYVNLNGTADVKATFTAEGRKKNCIIKLEEIEKISSVHREKNEDNTLF